jgi:hypothetical protein
MRDVVFEEGTECLNIIWINVVRQSFQTEDENGTQLIMTSYLIIMIAFN